ncbi:MAG: glycosyltransferase family 1 protein [Bacteroidetes bacterium HGW-Bacteroidetes-7]|jgi:glycosyltransferase involved in cell wall biosynthesis|nr:MAG: glycosyltransferase family 1 protein [Bacteroidetes bacterium HGW-Bacteroidetes-7]
MKIAIEAQRIFRKKKHGMDFVALESVRELQKLDKENEYFIIVSPGDDESVLQETDNFHIVKLKAPLYPVWEQVALLHTVNKIKPDILHCTSNTAPVFCSTPLVLTLHDIIFLEKRAKSNASLYQTMGWYYRKFVVPAIIPKCKKIITVSNYEAGVIKKRLNLGDDKVIPVYNGFGEHFKRVDDFKKITSAYINHESYLFFLGNTDPKKNTENVFKAYSIYLDKSNVKLPLLVADLDNDYINKILAKEGISHIKDFIHAPGYIPNNHLPAIYSGAFAFLYPSLRESFGIPILESMACETPVITSNVSAMPEIASDAAILVSPENPHEIANAIMALEDKELYKTMVAKGKERIKIFSWKNCAQSLLDIYKTIYNEQYKR